MNDSTSQRETPKALAAFNEYLLLGPGRSLAKLAQTLGKSSGYTRQLEAWSSVFLWVERARAYDALQAQERRRQVEEETRLMNERHAMIGTTQQDRAIKQIETLINARSFGSMAAVQLLKLALDIERVARGASTEQIALTDKNGGAIETDVIVETFWGRGTDPRRTERDTDDSAEVHVEFGQTDEDDEPQHGY